jgi:hypothetical protein
MLGALPAPDSDSIHYALGRRAALLVALAGLTRKRLVTTGFALLASEAHQGDPFALVDYLLILCLAWTAPAWVASALMVLAAFVAATLLGDGGRDIALVVGLGVAFFCGTGGLYMGWKSLFALAARRRSRKHGTTDGRVVRFAARAQPTNRSLGVQAGVAALAVLFTAAKL